MHSHFVNVKFKNFSQTIEKFKKDISTHQCCIFVGAGISMLPPCSLPSGDDLKNIALVKFLAHPQLRKYVRRIQKHPKYLQIVPEIIFQRIYETLREGLYPFFKVLEYANPNVAHQSLGYFAERKIPVFTTNFDLLIESCTSAIDKVIHLHGSLGDFSQMMIRINQVGKGLDIKLRKTLQLHTLNKSLYVLGYSGNDKDIIDAFNACSPRNVYWLVRSKTDKRALENINRLDSSLGCKIIEGDLNSLFHELVDRFSIPHAQHSVQNSSAMQNKRMRYLANLSNNIDPAHKFAALGKIFYELEEYQTAAKVHIEAANAGLHGGVHNKYWFYAEAANCMRIIGDFDKGFSYARRIFSSKGARRYLSVLTASYNIYGLLLMEKEKQEPRKAIPYFKKALKTLEAFEKTPEAQNWQEGVNVFMAEFIIIWDSPMRMIYTNH